VLTMVGTTQAEDAQARLVQPAFVVGSQVRITSGAGTPQAQGTVAAIDARVVTLWVAGNQSFSLPLKSITAAEVKVGEKRRTAWGAGVGAVAGLAWGLTIPVDPTCGQSPTAPTYCVKSSDERYGYPLLLGAFAGGAVGWLTKTEHWVPIEVATTGLVGSRSFGLRTVVRF
jgi:hypothetical protein